MNDLSNLLYTEQELDLLRRLSGQEVTWVKAENHLFIDIACQSGFGISAEPEEVWVSSRSFDEVGYSWVKRAKLREEEYGANQEPKADSNVAAGIATDIAILRCAVVFSEETPNEPLESGNANLDRMVESLEKRFRSRTFNTTLINPELLFSSGEPQRCSLVDIGFMVKIGSRLVSVATFDNAFFLDRPLIAAEHLDAAFFQTYARLPLLPADRGN
ncbi:hypothetical protein [Niveibacterium microcysteis]|uniref:Uncharacterized protein n=1 Tax=Niveibacterium microcysteis TaxID=2811415 RepID=A0ABX7MBZ0_9RHOO|nr:hypothetical protein [Niveibacterium microcysteis]QSI78208.1 hypothetical protein JY500_06105 [Niveibacterium microcysteis]